MNKNGLDKQTISTMWTDLQTDSVLLFTQMTIEKEKAAPSQNQKSAIGTFPLVSIVPKFNHTFALYRTSQ
jgi:hypothetical protein